ncbi:histidine phosphatase family protein [Candidatus Woesebacteria bacterium]|nr:histidine phosphatase family protein [Candidatus Woesebacteria bacterium]
MKVYLVRHGQSLGNEGKVFQLPDTPLSSLGKKQAKILAGRLKGISFDVIYTSPLARAHQTSKIISKELKKPVEVWEDIQETKNPKEVVALSRSSPKAKRIRKLIRRNYHKGDWRYSDEETFDELNERGEKVIAHLLKHHQRQNVLIVSHAGMIKMILARMIFGNSLTPKIYWDFKYHSWLKNTGITICDYSPDYGWVLETLNDTTHL